MLDICNDIVSMSRGDTVKFSLFINSNTDLEPEQYILPKDCFVFFGIMEPNQIFENAILKKTLTHEDLDEDGNIVIKLNPEDTINLLPGKYYYQIKIKIKQGSDYIYNTITDKKGFFIIE